MIRNMLVFCGSLVRFVLNIFFMKLKCFKNKWKIGYAFDLSWVFFPPLQLAEQDQDLYRNFTMTISERWQQEVAETVFDAINQDTDKLEQKRKQKPRIDDVDLGKFLKMNTMDNKLKIVKYSVNVKYILNLKFMLLQFFFFSSSSVWEKRFTFCFASILQLSYYSLHGD